MGIRKAVRHGSRFDAWSSALIVIGYALPSFLFALLLIVLFAGGTSLNWFPVRGLVSENFDELSLVGKVADYFWHLVLPVAALSSPAAFAVDESDAVKKPECPKGQVWDSKTQQCVLQTSG